MNGARYYIEWMDQAGELFDGATSDFPDEAAAITWAAQHTNNGAGFTVTVWRRNGGRNPFVIVAEWRVPRAGEREGLTGDDE